MHGLTGRRRQGQQGQVLVIVALAIIALLTGAALVVDGGNAFSQQRITQNAADAAANAGAVLLMQDAVAKHNNVSPLPYSDAAVQQAISTKALADNQATAVTAYYTTIAGKCILGGGATADPPCNAQPGAIAVGSGNIPTVNADAQGAPQCPLAPGDPASTPTLACGVAVYASKTFSTFLAGIAGIPKFTSSGPATAVAGVLTSLCGADQPCGFLPVTFPTSLTLCDNTGSQLQLGQGPYVPIVNQALTSSNEMIIGLCGSGDGTVGWLAVQPEDSGAGCNGAVPDLVCDIERPDNPPLTLPVWIQTVSGNTNSTNVQDALNNTYAGNVVGTYEFGLDKTVVIPLYDCVGTVTSQASTDTCAQAQSNQGGQNNWFHIVGILGFVLDHAYINNSNPECNQDPGNPKINGNGMNGCLKGWLVNVSIPGGTIGTGDGQPGSAFGVQLIH